MFLYMKHTDIQDIQYTPTAGLTLRFKLSENHNFVSNMYGKHIIITVFA